MRSLKPLSKEEKSSLEADLKKTRDLAEWKRLFVILSYNKGYTVEELTELTRLSRWTIEEYFKDYNSKNKTKNDPRGGSSSKLTETDEKELEQHLAETTYLKVKDIVAYVQKRFGKTYSRSGMTAWLSGHGFTYKCPEKIPGKVDPEAQAKFIKAYEELKKALGIKDELYFLDAVHPEYQSQAVCGWIKKGECKTLQTTGKQLRLHILGAVNLNEMKIFTNEYSTIDADSVIDFLKKLETQSDADVIHVILDNAKSHKNSKLNEYLKTSRIKLTYLPPYSPNLNPIERLWKILRETTLYNRYFSTCAEFFTAVREFFTEKIPRMKDLLVQRITDTFQVIKLNPICLA